MKLLLIYENKNKSSEIMKGRQTDKLTNQKPDMRVRTFNNANSNIRDNIAFKGKPCINL